jgi:hypothetical protein
MAIQATLEMESVIRRAQGEELGMSDYLVIGGWAGRRKIPVNIISETPDSFQIQALERVFLPGRGILKEGQSTLVSKRLVTVEHGDQSR